LLNRAALKRKTIFGLAGERFRPRKDALDIIIPVAAKDTACLKEAITAARRCLRHNIGRIYLVYGGERPRESWFVSKGVILVDEREVAPIAKSDINYHPGGRDRSGWLYQQLIKLSCDQLSSEEHILALDSDTVFTRPQRLIRNGRVVLNTSHERHEPYYRMIRYLFPDMPLYPYSFVSHHMLFTKTYLCEMKRCLERDGRKWWETILDNLDSRETSGFSEYETYGNYMISRHPAKVRVEHCLNQSFSTAWIGRLWYIRLRHPLIKTASFHAW
jgi:hypothetical protein